VATRTNATRPAGVLRPEQLARHTSLERLAPADALAPWVEHHWCLSWDLPQGTTFPSELLGHPAANLSVELGHARGDVGTDRVVVTGVATRRFDVRLAHWGWVFGVRFRPGGLAALTGLDAAVLTDRTVPARDLLPDSVTEPLRALTPDTDPADAARVADEALATLLPVAPDPDYDAVLRLVDDLHHDRALVQVAQLADRHGLSRRRVERQFRRYVGVTPKWVISRYRMHDVVADLDAGYDGTLADLAASLGWYDQAHFTRDFTRHVGVPPREYRS
jgi:AraC-like DNA-binding protein